MLNEISAIPAGLLAVPANQLSEWLPAPTLIHLPGRHPEPLFVSVLLHGNEDTGWEAMRRLLHKYQGVGLPRALSLFIGNIVAARSGQRHLSGQPDYNRIWGAGSGPEMAMMQRVVDTLRRLRPFASIDIHNNTGLNPHYACINRLDTPFLHLATLFSRTVVYFTRPEGVQSLALAALCPAVTVECGKVGQAHSTDHAHDFVEAVLHLDHFPQQPVAQGDYDLFHTVAIVKLRQGVRFCFGQPRPGFDICFQPDLDRLNFRELPAGTVLGRLATEGLVVEAWDEQGVDQAGRYFFRRGDELVTRRPVMPSMLTLDQTVIAQDCLGYLMERFTHRGG